MVYRSPTAITKTISWGDWTITGVPVSQRLYNAARYFSSVNDTDSSVCIIDYTTGLNYSLYGVRSDPSYAQIKVYAGGVLRNEGTGWWDNKQEPWIGRASGAAFCGGLVLSNELHSKTLNHALAIGWPRSLILARQPVFPAKTSDGSCTNTVACIPMGARIQLDPALSEKDFRSFGLTPSDIILAKAFQTYGAYVVDSSATVSIYVESGLGRGRTAYHLSVEWPAKLLSHLSVVVPPNLVRLEDRNSMANFIHLKNIYERIGSDAAVSKKAPIE